MAISNKGRMVAPMCLGCKRFNRSMGAPACTAFPAGIPLAIWESRADHRQPYAGDGGTQYEPKGPDDAAYVARLFNDDGAV